MLRTGFVLRILLGLLDVYRRFALLYVALEELDYSGEIGDAMVAMTIDDRGPRIVRAIALLIFAVMVALPCAAQEKFRFPIGESSKNLSCGPLWVAAKMGFFERENLDAPIITMRGSPIPSTPPACGHGIVCAAALHAINHTAFVDSANSLRKCQRPSTTALPFLG
jgi:hypothetical protein